MNEYPFQTPEYKNVYKNHFIPSDNPTIALGGVEYEITPDKRAVLVGMKPVLNGQEVTDYGPSRFASDVVTTHQILKEDYHIKTIQYDYIREDSSVYATLKTMSALPPTRQEVSPYIILPPTWDAYLEVLERTDRKELKRKFRRLDTVPHEVTFHAPSENDEAFGDFVRLHKSSDPAKDIFMTPPMERFFHDVYHLTVPQWKQRIAILKIENKPAAAVFFFENDSSLLLYNSGYDPSLKYYSGGLLLVARLIRYAIEGKKKTFDFLRGGERYKYDLGGKDCQLYQFIFSS